MICTQSSYKTFLVSSNVALLFIGLSVFILGIKMKELLSVFLLIEVPLIAQAVKAVTATGFFISVTGVTGIGGACSEALWLILVHLIALGIIVMMEFGLGVTLLIVRKTVENYTSSLECNTSCAATLDSLVLDYALPAAGLMLTIIIVEATMMYSAIKLCSRIREAPKIIEYPDVDIPAQNVQMGRVSVGGPLPSYGVSPLPIFSPRLNYLPNRMHPFNGESPFPLYPNRQESPKPPEYSTLPSEQLPPTYIEVAPAILAVSPRIGEVRRPGTCNSV